MVLQSTMHPSTHDARTCTTALVCLTGLHHLATTQGWDTKKRSSFSCYPTKSTGQKTVTSWAGCLWRKLSNRPWLTMPMTLFLRLVCGRHPMCRANSLPPEPEYQRLENGVEAAVAGETGSKLTSISMYQKAKTS